MDEQDVHGVKGYELLEVEAVSDSGSTRETIANGKLMNRSATGSGRKSERSSEELIVFPPGTY
ncbi:MAG TPA: hypothetical protein VGY66_22490 [Gemmataceae bacterium]|jgi:hypothetical protein|nr:hypothetical protein [Gemmataceae bacterium]